MSEIGAYEAKTHFAELLERVAKGESITITRHGRPVAMMVPVTPKPPVTEIFQQMRELRRHNHLGDLTIRELIEEGRRF